MDVSTNHDIIVHPGDGPERLRKGKLIRTTLNVEAHARSINELEAEERMVSKLWPDWPERIQEAISFRIGPSTNPSQLYQVPLGRIVETVLMWAGAPHDMPTIRSACEFLSGRLNLNFTDGGNQPHHINPREIAKSTLLFVLAEVAKRAKGFTRIQVADQQPYQLN